MAGALEWRLRILMVDDSEEDAFLVQHALQQSGFGEWFGSVRDGREAIAYLAGEGHFKNREKHPFPNLIFLDLKMPLVNGFEVLQWLKEHEECRTIPTVVFSSSALEADVLRAYQLGANAYMTKPSSMKEMTELIGLTYRYWARCAKPSHSPQHICTGSKV